jgi:hypothetical protein
VVDVRNVLSQRLGLLASDLLADVMPHGEGEDPGGRATVLQRSQEPPSRLLLG